MSHQEDSLTPLFECLACGSQELERVLDLGDQPLANDFRADNNDQPYFPLMIDHCKDCHHVQLSHIVDPEIIYTNYAYVSGTSQTMKKHFEWFKNYTIDYYTMMAGYKPNNVFDIGCNDGSQLDHYKASSLKTYGVDPATNLYPISSKHHIVFREFFNADYVDRHADQYDLIIAQNSFAHNPDPLGFLTAAKKIMHVDSLMFIQTSQADMILNGEFDTIYHEHISFYCINSMHALCKRAGLLLTDVIKCPLHGNSFIFVITKNIDAWRPYQIENLLAMEKSSGLYDQHTYDTFASTAVQTTNSLNNWVDHYRRAGFLVVGYGAAAKGMTLINYTKLKLDLIVDDNPLKQNTLAPGTLIPVVPSDRLKEIDGDILLVPLAWNFFDEITEKVKKLRPEKDDVFFRILPRQELYNKGERIDV